VDFTRPGKPAAPPNTLCRKIGFITAFVALAVCARAADGFGQDRPGTAHRGGAAKQSSQIQLSSVSGELPKTDRLSSSGIIFTDWYSRQSCTSGRSAIAAGRYPLRAGLGKGDQRGN
jgi:hypothetical protein